MSNTSRNRVLWLVIVAALISVGASGSRERLHDEPSGAAEEEIAALRSDLAELRAALLTVEEQVQFITIVPENVNGVSGPHMIITGCNLHVRSGSGTTEDGVPWNDDESANLGKYQGLGNLIIGYNEKWSLGLTDRQGSHNVVIGLENKFSSCGGLVVGVQNTVSGRYASVSGGRANTASGNMSTVSGGWRNEVSGLAASISGGMENQAGERCSSVSGGYDNTASGFSASVGGGYRNTASARGASVSGGKEQKDEIDIFAASLVPQRLTAPLPR